jgi:hypothetical protein
MNNKKESLKIQTLKKFRWLQRGSKFNKNEQKSSISNFRPLITPILCFLRSPWAVVVRVSYCILLFLEVEILKFSDDSNGVRIDELTTNVQEQLVVV